MEDCEKNKKKKKVNAGEREDVITDFYDLVTDKLLSSDDLIAKEAVDSFLELTSESTNICSIGKGVKICHDRQEFLGFMSENGMVSEGTVFEGIDMGKVSMDGDRVSVEVTLRYLDEESGCVRMRMQTDEFVFDDDGKIAEYDNTFDDEETNCEGDENEEERLYARRQFILRPNSA